MDMSDRIQLRMREQGFKAVDVVSRTGLSKGTISQWINGHTKPRGDNLLLLANALNASPEWLQFGVIPSPGQLPNAETELYEFPIICIPDKNSLLQGSTTQSETFSVSTKHLNELGVSPNNGRVIKICSNSMEQTLFDGDLVLVDTSSTVPLSGGIFAFKFSDEYEIKRFSKDYESNWNVYSDNLQHPANRHQTITEETLSKLTILGHVVGILHRKL